MKIENPELIDVIVQQNTAQGTKQNFSGKWFIAKPHELGGLFELRKRIKQPII